MWQNYLYVAVDTGEFGAALQAMTRLVDLQGSNSAAGVDVDVLDLLIARLVARQQRVAQPHSSAPPAEQQHQQQADLQAAIAALDDADDGEVSVRSSAPCGSDNDEEASQQFMTQARRQVEQLLGHITARSAGQHPRVWAAAARYHSGFGQPERALDARLKQMRAAAPVDWPATADATRFAIVSDAALALADAYLEVAAAAAGADERRRHLYSARLHLRGVLKKAEPNWRTNEAYGQLEAKLASVLVAEQQQQQPSS